MSNTIDGSGHEDRESREGRGTGEGQHAVQPDRYAVIGHPVAHSKSPTIHAAFAKSTGEALRYVHLPAPLNGFEPTVRGFIAGGGRGLNVTVPFKMEAFALADTLSERARAAGAVNTLQMIDVDGTVCIHGDNTDGAGLVRDIEQNLRRPIEGCRVLLLGAGGAARGVILPLLDRRPRQLTIVNRTAARAFELRDRFAEHAKRQGCQFDAGGVAPVAAPYDIVVNATSGSLSGDVPVFGDGAIGPSTLVYDMMYGAEPTVFMRHATALGAIAHDGLGMLVEQAAESFLLWRGRLPEGQPVLAILRERTKAPNNAPNNAHRNALGNAPESAPQNAPEKDVKPA